ncbi:MAG: FecR domain-containing protein [Candidatus Sumerlaeia bacterium]|nr:FecR domain-containing protein [Candidatus Sumerlaeia bacterium]
MSSSNAHSLGELRAALRGRSASFVAEVAHQRGLAELRDPATGTARPIEPGVRVARGMVVAVKTGTLLLRFDDGSDVWLSAGAELELGGWSDVGRRLRLAAGRALALVAKNSRRLFEIETEFARVLVTGTAFEVDLASASARVAVLHGSVEVASEGVTVAAASGRAVQAARGLAPVVRPASGRVAAWLDGIEASRSNPAVSPAYRAAAKRLAPSTPNTIQEMAPMLKYTLAAVAALVLIGGAFLFATSKSVSVERTASPAESAGAAPSDVLSSPAAMSAGGAPQWSSAAPTTERQERREVRLRLADGTEVSFDPTDPEAMEKATASLPEDMRAQMRQIAERAMSQTGGAPDGLPGLADSDHAALMRESENAGALVRDLIAQGMSPEEAGKVVSAGLSDSLQKQIGDKAKISAQVVPGKEGDQQRMMLFVGVEAEDKGAPSPTATPAAKQ